MSFSSGGDRAALRFAKLCTGAGKTRCILLVCLGVLARRDDRACRVLVTTPDLASKRNVLTELSDTTDHSFLSRLGLDDELRRCFAAHVYDYEGGASEGIAQRCRSAWVIVSTVQKIANNLASDRVIFRPDDFSEVCVDEGDLGTLPSSSLGLERRARRAWSLVPEAFKQHARVLLLSATLSQAKRTTVTPYCDYNYSTAVTDRVVKRLRVIYVIPAAICFNRAETVTSLDKLSNAQRQACEASEACSAVLIACALSQLVALRRASGIPYLMHVVAHKVGPQAQFIEQVTRRVSQLASVHHCPVTGRPLVAGCAHGSGELAGRENLDRFRRYDGLDILVTCKLMGRAVDAPLLAVTLNLKRFSKSSSSAFEQCIIGRGTRILTPEHLRTARHPDLHLFERQLESQGPLAAIEQTAVVIESEPNGNRALYAHFAEQNRAPAVAAAVEIEEQRVAVQEMLHVDVSADAAAAVVGGGGSPMVNHPPMAMALPPPAPPPLAAATQQAPIVHEQTPPELAECAFIGDAPTTELCSEFHEGRFRAVAATGGVTRQLLCAAREIECDGVTLGLQSARAFDDLLEYFSSLPPSRRASEWHPFDTILEWHQRLHGGGRLGASRQRQLLQVLEAPLPHSASYRATLLDGAQVVIHRADNDDGSGPRFRVAAVLA